MTTISPLHLGPSQRWFELAVEISCWACGSRAESSNEFDRDLVEWNYGEYEGRRSVEIHTERPDWNLFRDGCPGVESPSEIAGRADRVVNRVREVKGDVLLFTSGHFLRVLAARWLGFVPTAHSGYFMLSTASLSALRYEHDLSRPVIRLWNDTHHVDVETLIEGTPQNEKTMTAGAAPGT